MTAQTISNFDNFLRCLDDAIQNGDIKDSSGSLQASASDLRASLAREAITPGKAFRPVILDVPSTVLPSTGTPPPAPGFATCKVRDDQTGGV